MKFFKSKGVAFLGFALCTAVVCGSGYWWYTNSSRAQTAAVATTFKTPAEQESVYARFDMEVFDTIMQHYWQKGDEGQLSELFRLATAKAIATTTDIQIPSHDRAGTAAMLKIVFDGIPESGRKDIAVNTSIIVLANLAPQGRSGLLSNEQEQQFRDHAANIDRSTDLYSTLGVKDGAPVAEVTKAAEQKTAELAASTSPAAVEELKQVKRAKAVLANDQSKAIYDQTKIEPSVVSHVINIHTLYLDLSKVTPATLQEFVNNLQNTQGNADLEAMIIDVRGNIGGTLDFAKYLLALFEGPQQYAFDLYHQGDLNVERTPAVAKIDALSRFKEIVILTDAMTQSTAELTTAMFKRLHMAKVVGTKTRGWGTVENTYPLTTVFDATTTYSVLLVNSLTLREDNNPIEGRGVDPDFDISVKGWQQSIKDAFRTSGFASAIIQTVGQQ